MRNGNIQTLWAGGHGLCLRLPILCSVMAMAATTNASDLPVVAPYPHQSTTISVIGPFHDNHEVRLPAIGSEIVEPRTIRLSNRGGISTASIAFQFKGEPVPGDPIRLDVAILGRDGKPIAHKTLRCTDGRLNAKPVYLFGRKIYGNSVNHEDFKIPFGDPRDVRCVVIKFTEAQ